MAGSSKGSPDGSQHDAPKQQRLEGGQQQLQQQQQQQQQEGTDVVAQRDQQHGAERKGLQRVQRVSPELAGKLTSLSSLSQVSHD